MKETIVPLLYLTSAALFVLGLKRLSKVRSARRGNAIAALAMFIAIAGALYELGTIDYRWILGGAAVGTVIGIIAALRVAMTAMPEMVALFNGFGGGASALVPLALAWTAVVERPTAGASAASVMGTVPVATTGLSILIGGLTLSGSLIAFLKLQGRLRKGAPILLPARHLISVLCILAAVGAGAMFSFIATEPDPLLYSLLGLVGGSLVLGVLLVIPIGGADMPVVVSLLNSYSGLAACAAGFVILNPILIVAGAMVGAAGLILTQIMCVAMNRSLANVLVGGFGAVESSSGDARDYKRVTSADPEEAAMVLGDAESVVFVPGYGLAVAQAQHTVKELADILETRGTKVAYAIHPVAGRMPGHMNVLLAEADVSPEQLKEMDEINPEFRDTDVAIIIGANDVVNPAAVTDDQSPIWGMPILEVHHARSVMVVKRSLSPGYANIKNELFEYDNTVMLFGDAKKIARDLTTELKDL